MGGPKSAALRIEANALSDPPGYTPLTLRGFLLLRKPIKPSPNRPAAAAAANAEGEFRSGVYKTRGSPSFSWPSLSPSRKSCFLFGGMPRQQHRKVSGLPLPFELPFPPFAHSSRALCPSLPLKVP